MLSIGKKLKNNIDTPYPVNRKSSGLKDKLHFFTS